MDDINRALTRLLTRAGLPDATGALSLLPPDFSGEFVPECRILLLPGASGLRRCGAASVVTYGLSARDSLTFSAVGEGRAVVAIQRELPTVQGGVLEPQELPVRCDAATERFLALFGALLLCGVAPDTAAELLLEA